MKKLTKNQLRKKELKRRAHIKENKRQKLNNKIFNKNLKELDSAIDMFSKEIDKLEKEYPDEQ